VGRYSAGRTWGCVCRCQEVQAIADDEGCGDTLEWGLPFGVRFLPSNLTERGGAELLRSPEHTV
jgi:hypothetical protein